MDVTFKPSAGWMRNCRLPPNTRNTSLEVSYTHLKLLLRAILIRGRHQATLFFDSAYVKLLLDRMSYTGAWTNFADLVSSNWSVERRAAGWYLLPLRKVCVCRYFSSADWDMHGKGYPILEFLYDPMPLLFLSRSRQWNCAPVSPVTPWLVWAASCTTHSTWQTHGRQEAPRSSGFCSPIRNWRWRTICSNLQVKCGISH